MALAEAAKQGALEYMSQIEEIQKEQQLVAQMLQEARQLQADAKAGKGNNPDSKNKTSSIMPDYMVDYMKDNGLAYDTKGDDNVHSAEEWAVAITSLQAHQDQLGTNTQQMMVFVQDFIGQYNSYLQGANSAVQQSNQTLADLARLR
jgi:prefoldin subunit 5